MADGIYQFSQWVYSAMEHLFGRIWSLFSSRRMDFILEHWLVIAFWLSLTAFFIDQLLRFLRMGRESLLVRGVLFAAKKTRALCLRFQGDEPQPEPAIPFSEDEPSTRRGAQRLTPVPAAPLPEDVWPDSDAQEEPEEFVDLFAQGSAQYLGGEPFREEQASYNPELVSETIIAPPAEKAADAYLPEPSTARNPGTERADTADDALPAEPDFADAQTSGMEPELTAAAESMPLTVSGDAPLQTAAPEPAAAKAAEPTVTREHSRQEAQESTTQEQPDQPMA